MQAEAEGHHPHGPLLPFLNELHDCMKLPLRPTLATTLVTQQPGRLLSQEKLFHRRNAEPHPSNQRQLSSTGKQLSNEVTEALNYKVHKSNFITKIPQIVMKLW